MVATVTAEAQGRRDVGPPAVPFSRKILRLVALTAVILGQSGYFLIWLAIRVWGDLTLTFGNWGPSWLLWFERWVEPFVLLGGMALVGYVLWREMSSADAVRERASVPPGR